MAMIVGEGRMRKISRVHTKVEWILQLDLIEVSVDVDEYARSRLTLQGGF
jgi:hypothetical protein